MSMISRKYLYLIALAREKALRPRRGHAATCRRPPCRRRSATWRRSWCGHRGARQALRRAHRRRRVRGAVRGTLAAGARRSCPGAVEPAQRAPTVAVCSSASSPPRSRRWRSCRRPFARRYPMVTVEILSRATSVDPGRVCRHFEIDAGIIYVHSGGEPDLGHAAGVAGGPRAAGAPGRARWRAAEGDHLAGGGGAAAGALDHRHAEPAAPSTPPSPASARRRPPA